MMCIDVCQSWGEHGEQERLLAMPGHAKVSASRQMRLMKMEWLSFLIIKSVLESFPWAKSDWLQMLEGLWLCENNV